MQRPQSLPVPALPSPALLLGQMLPIARALAEYFAHVPHMQLAKLETLW